MPLRDYNTRSFHRRLYGGILETVTLLKRNNDQQEGTVTSLQLFECLLPNQVIEGRVEWASKSRYAGEAVELFTEAGSLLRVTVNHPVLTLEGFVAAGCIEPGDDLLHDLASGGFAENVENSPTPVQDVFESFAESGRRYAAHSPRSFEFHGDGQSMKGKVNVVWPDRELLRNRQFQTSQRSSDFVFDGFDSCSVDVHSNGIGCLPFGRTFFASDGLVGSSQLSSTFGRSHLGPFQPFTFAGSSQLDSSGLEDFADCSSHQPSSFGNLDGGFPSEVSVDNDRSNGIKSRTSGSIGESVHFGFGSHFDVRGPKPTEHRSSRNPNFQTDLASTFPGRIASSKVVDVRRFHYAGPVFDVGTSVGYYTASEAGPKVFVSNCRRSRIAHTGEPILGTMAAQDRTRWHIPRTELDRYGISELNVLDRIQDKFGQVWQPESGETIDIALFKNQVHIDCRRVN